MRHKLYVMFVFCVLVLSAMGLSISGEAQKVKLPSRNTTPKKILSAAGLDVMAKFSSERKNNISEIYINRSWLEKAAVSASESTGEVVAIAVGGGGEANVGFKFNGFRNTGPTPWKNVVATVKADISHVHTSRSAVRIILIFFKDGNYVSGLRGEKVISAKGSISVTSPPFTIEPSADYHAVVFFVCFGSSNDTASVAGTVKEITFDKGK